MRMMRLHVMVVVFALQAALVTPAANAQSEQFKWPAWGAYEKMNCADLSFELQMMRNDLVTLQRPDYAGDQRVWNEAKSRFEVVKALYRERCRKLSPEEAKMPDPPELKKLPPEQELVSTALKALKAGRRKLAEDLLQRGASAGYPSAQYNLGILYLVTGNKADGVTWLQRAADNGSDEAKKALHSQDK